MAETLVQCCNVWPGYQDIWFKMKRIWGFQIGQEPPMLTFFTASHRKAQGVCTGQTCSRCLAGPAIPPLVNHVHQPYREVLGGDGPHLCTSCHATMAHACTDLSRKAGLCCEPVQTFAKALPKYQFHYLSGLGAALFIMAWAPTPMRPAMKSK